MPKTKMKAGAEIETLNQAELIDALGQTTTTWFQEEARGFTTARFSNVATVVGANVQVPKANDDVFGPEQGFAWRVSRISVSGLSANDVLSVFREAATPMNFLCYLTATAPVFPGKGIILRSGEKLLIANTAALTATGDIVVTGEAVQCSELDIFKLF